MHKFILLGNKDVLYQIPHYRALVEHAERYGKVYDAIPIKYDYTNRCMYCEKEIRKTYWTCIDCHEVWRYERDKKRRDEFIRTQDGHHVRSRGEKEIDDWLFENHIRHEYEKPVKKYLFSMDEKFERELNEGAISKRLKSIFRREGISLSGDVMVTRKREKDKFEIADYRDRETYSIEKEKRELKIYKKARRPMYCDWYLPDQDIYVEYWGMMKDVGYLRAREIKIKEYKRLPLKLLSIGSEDLNNLDEKLRKKFRELGVMLD
jgi:hypothetical protein